MKSLIAFLVFVCVQPAYAADSGDLYRAIVNACGCKVLFVRVVNPADNSTWSVQYDPSATAQQQTAGNAVLSIFDMAAQPIRAMQIVSTAFPGLNGSYAIDPASQQKVQAISLYVAVNGKFPAGQSAQAWPDINGAVHQFPTTVEWQAFATAMGDLVAAIDLGQSPTQPKQLP